MLRRDLSRGLLTALGLIYAGGMVLPACGQPPRRKRRLGPHAVVLTDGPYEMPTAPVSVPTSTPLPVPTPHTPTTVAEVVDQVFGARATWEWQVNEDGSHGWFAWIDQQDGLTASVNGTVTVGTDINLRSVPTRSDDRVTFYWYGSPWFDHRVG